MAAIPLRDETLRELKDKVVVISGSAHGIGLATVTLLFTHGAKVIHGDWDASAGSAVDNSLSSSLTSPKVPGGESTFVQTDVTSYSSVLNLFDTAWKKYGRVDVAISNAGVQEFGGWFEKGLGLEGVKTVGTAGFKSSPGLPSYTAAKHGVLGLIRSLRPYLPKTYNVRLNAICPWMTDTVMVTGVKEGWVKEGLPINTPEHVARVIIETALGGRMQDEFEEEGEGEGEGAKKVVRYNGRAVFVEGGRGWDIESGIEGTEEIWLGEEVSRTLSRGQEVLGDGTDSQW
ncbi:hypothetical protein BKA65DRAFT_515258 [Rhexocercosporidium sp. MPI-PUGE-AT-0058]|nr:hypothetical protein BKA65DRAFT_515258 [Rhexocercosporidium sp. MPI-PUGE-AT-0058]